MLDEFHDEPYDLPFQLRQADYSVSEWSFTHREERSVWGLLVAEVGASTPIEVIGRLVDEARRISSDVHFNLSDDPDLVIRGVNGVRARFVLAGTGIYPVLRLWDRTVFEHEEVQAYLEGDEVYPTMLEDLTRFVEGTPWSRIIVLPHWDIPVGREFVRRKDGRPD